jgi:hypothetical protein
LTNYKHRNTYVIMLNVIVFRRRLISTDCATTSNLGCIAYTLELLSQNPDEKSYVIIFVSEGFYTASGVFYQKYLTNK